jgi:KaiC/GvpD/RAD55 family RecA-like ATPase
MSSKLIIVSVEKMQNKIKETVRDLGNLPGIYVSLNKTHQSIEQSLIKENVDPKKLFFIDCVSSQRISEDVLYVHPTDLEKIKLAIKEFIKDIPGKKFLIIDALSTFLIYNDENKVAAFVQEINEYASRHQVDIIAISPITKGEELLTKIFNFFDEVKK